MRPQIASRLYDTCDREIQKRLPMFIHVRERGHKRVRLYRWDPRDEVSVFLMLVLSPNTDAFTWEAGWSPRHEFPSHLYPMSPRGNKDADIPPAEPIAGEFRFRIPDLWDPGKDTWWHVRGDTEKRDLTLEEFASVDWNTYSGPDYSDEQVAATVGKAIERIATDAMPFVRERIMATTKMDIGG